MLSYIPRDKVRHEFVSVTPEGFRFRKQNMDSVGQLIKWFKVGIILATHRLSHGFVFIFPLDPDPQSKYGSGF